MITPTAADNEAERLATLHSLQILDTAPEERYDRLTRMAQRLFGVPIALLSLVDENRQWFKSCQGLSVSETHRDISFCGHAILGDDPLVVTNALEDERFVDNPLVLDTPSIRFYAGHPITAMNGHKLGTLCVIDSTTRGFNESDMQLLHDLAAMVEHEIRALELAKQVEQRTLELLQAKKVAEQANEAKNVFLSNMSHELRTPLHAITSYVGLAKRYINTHPDEKLHKYISNIGNSAQLLRQFIDALLDLTDLELGKMAFDFIQINMIDILRAAISDNELQTKMQAKKQKFVMDYENVNPRIMGDSTQLLHLFLHILANSSKYSPPESTIHIDLSGITQTDGNRLSRDQLQIVVRDQGVGIPEAELEQIFDNFTESSTTHTSAGGKGVGLALSKKIVEQHKGTILAQNNDDGGTSIVIILPRIPL